MTIEKSKTKYDEMKELVLFELKAINNDFDGEYDYSFTDTEIDKITNDCLVEKLRIDKDYKEKYPEECENCDDISVWEYEELLAFILEQFAFLNLENGAKND